MYGPKARAMALTLCCLSVTMTGSHKVRENRVDWVWTPENLLVKNLQESEDSEKLGCKELTRVRTGYNRKTFYFASRNWVCFNIV
jgi:hypothetical protein